MGIVGERTGDWGGVGEEISDYGEEGEGGLGDVCACIVGSYQ